MYTEGKKKGNNQRKKEPGHRVHLAGGPPGHQKSSMRIEQHRKRGNIKDGFRKGG